LLLSSDLSLFPMADPAAEEVQCRACGHMIPQANIQLHALRCNAPHTPSEPPQAAHGSPMDADEEDEVLQQVLDMSRREHEATAAATPPQAAAPSADAPKQSRRKYYRFERQDLDTGEWVPLGDTTSRYLSRKLRDEGVGDFLHEIRHVDATDGMGTSACPPPLPCARAPPPATASGLTLGRAQ